MYKKADQTQLYIEDFAMQFGGQLTADNRWVKQAEIIPWDFIEGIYAQNFTKDTGVTAINSRIAFGAIYIKERQNLTDRETVEYIAENPYAQYFLGLSVFTEAPLFDASMMVHFRKRFPADKVEEINKRIFAASQKKDDAGDDAPPPPNSGKLILDATCAPADVRYPNDISLLNEARENLETIIDELWENTDKRGHKTSYSRKKARKEYLAITKQKQPKQVKMKKAIGKQLSYIQKNIETIGKLLLQTGLEVLQEKRIERMMTICELYRQQSYMHNSNVRKCENRIVSLRQPHIRCIVRGKAGRRFEFGQKLAFSVVNGFTFIEKQSYENFNEGISLINSVERYKSLHGVYPEAVLADQIYRNRDNLAYCKKFNIRLSGPRLGRPKTGEAVMDKAQEYKDNCERNIVESRNGISKRRFGLDLIMAYLPETAMTEAALAVLCMNVSLKLRALLSFLFNTLFRRFLTGFC